MRWSGVRITVIRLEPQGSYSLPEPGPVLCPTVAASNPTSSTRSASPIRPRGLELPMTLASDTAVLRLLCGAAGLARVKVKDTDSPAFKFSATRTCSEPDCFQSADAANLPSEVTVRPEVSAVADPDRPVTVMGEMHPDTRNASTFKEMVITLLSQGVELPCDMIPPTKVTGRMRKSSEWFVMAVKPPDTDFWEKSGVDASSWSTS